MLYPLYNINDMEVTNYQSTANNNMQILGFGLTGLLKLRIGLSIVQLINE